MIIHAGLALAETQLEAIRAVVLAQEKQACGWLIMPENLEQVLGWNKRTLQRHLNRGVQLGWWTIQKLADGQRLIRRVATHYIERKFALGHNFIKASIRKNEIGRIGLMRKRARQSTALTLQRMNEMRVHQEVERENKNVELRAEQFYIGECDVSRVRTFTSYRDTGYGVVRIPAHARAVGASSKTVAKQCSCCPETIRRALRDIPRDSLLTKKSSLTTHTGLIKTLIGADSHASWVTKR